VGEEERNKDRKNFGSPLASDCKLFEQTSERDETSPLNTSGVFESVRHFSENEENRPDQDSGGDTGCFPLESSDDEGRCSSRG